MRALRRPAPRLVFLVTFLLVLVLGLAGVAIAGGHERRATAFTTQVPPSNVAAQLKHGRSVCQGPIPVVASTNGVRLWIQAGTGPGRLQATVRSDHGAATHAGVPLTPDRSVTPVPYGTALHATFGRLVLSRGSISLCVRSLSAGTVNLLGSAPNPHSGTLRGAGKPNDAALSLLFTAPRHRTVDELLPTIFRRAALFHPRWVGAWTFYALAAALLVSVGWLAWTMFLAADDVDEDPRARVSGRRDASR